MNLRQRYNLGHRNNALHAVALNYINYILQSIQFSTAFKSTLPTLLLHSRHTTTRCLSSVLSTASIGRPTNYAAVCAQLRLQEDILKGSLISSYCWCCAFLWWKTSVQCCIFCEFELVCNCCYLNMPNYNKKPSTIRHHDACFQTPNTVNFSIYFFYKGQNIIECFFI